MPRRRRSVFDFTGNEAEDFEKSANRTPRHRRNKRSVLSLTPQKHDDENVAPAAATPSPQKKPRQEVTETPREKKHSENKTKSPRKSLPVSDPTRVSERIAKKRAGADVVAHQASPKKKASPTPPKRKRRSVITQQPQLSHHQDSKQSPNCDTEGKVGLLPEKAESEKKDELKEQKSPGNGKDDSKKAVTHAKDGDDATDKPSLEKMNPLTAVASNKNPPSDKGVNVGTENETANESAVGKAQLDTQVTPQATPTVTDSKSTQKEKRETTAATDNSPSLEKRKEVGEQTMTETSEQDSTTHGNENATKSRSENEGTSTSAAAQAPTKRPRAVKELAATAAKEPIKRDNGQDLESADPKRSLEGSIDKSEDSEEYDMFEDMKKQAKRTTEEKMSDNPEVESGKITETFSMHEREEEKVDEDKGKHKPDEMPQQDKAIIRKEAAVEAKDSAVDSVNDDSGTMVIDGEGVPPQLETHSTREVNKEPAPSKAIQAPQEEAESSQGAEGKPTSDTVLRKSQKTESREDTEKTRMLLMKRVRFIEPDKSYRSGNNTAGFLNYMKLHRKRMPGQRESVMTQDLSIPSAGSFRGDEKERQALLDELQYLLDGVFKTGGSGTIPNGNMSTQLICNSLRSLVKVLLRKPKKTVPEEESPSFSSECGTLMKILTQQPKLLKQIVNRLLTKFGSSRSIDVMLSLVFVIIFRSTSQVLLVDESDLDLLLNAFFRNSGTSLNTVEQAIGHGDDSKPKSTVKYLPRRRGILSRRLNDLSKSKSVLESVNELVIEAEIVDNGFKGFQNETDGSSYLIGMGLGLLVANQDTAREWMRSREHRRLDRVVAVLYSCERVICSKAWQKSRKREAQEHLLGNVNIVENETIPLVTEAAMKILEYTTFDSVCQRRIANESRVGKLTLDLIRRIVTKDEKICSGEQLLSSALRLCLNLTHDCEEGTEQFVKGNGVQVIGDCLTRELIDAGFIQGDGDKTAGTNEEMFDVRVLCLVLLASVAHKRKNVSDKLREMKPWGRGQQKGGIVSVVLEVLKNGVQRPFQEKDSDEEMGEAGPTRMEDRILIGYSCLLIGVLISKSEKNKEIVTEAVPNQTLLAIAAVLDEFVHFHHEVGIANSSIDKVYNDVITHIAKIVGVNDIGLADKQAIALLQASEAT